jgi:hypothetical protein
VFVYSCIVLVGVTIALIKKFGVSNPYSKGVGIAVALSILAVISLAQNYTHSLIPGANDGIGISNRLAYWIIGEDGWSQEEFKNSFERSTYISLFLIAAYPIVLLIESKSKSKTD